MSISLKIGSLKPNGEVWCGCLPSKAARLFDVKREGPNTGRQFYRCSVTDDEKRCKLFQWADELPSSSRSAPSSPAKSPQKRPLPSTPPPKPRSVIKPAPMPSSKPAPAAKAGGSSSDEFDMDFDVEDLAEIESTHSLASTSSPGFWTSLGSEKKENGIAMNGKSKAVVEEEVDEEEPPEDIEDDESTGFPTPSPSPTKRQRFQFSHPPSSTKQDLFAPPLNYRPSTPTPSVSGGSSNPLDLAKDLASSQDGWAQKLNELVKGIEKMERLKVAGDKQLELQKTLVKDGRAALEKANERIRLLEAEVAELKKSASSD